MRLKLHSLALAAICGAACAWPAAAFQAQPEGNTQVGPAEVRDFSLPGTPPPVEREPEPEATPEAPPPAEQPTSIPAPPAPSVVQPAPERPRAATPPPPRSDPRADTDAAEPDRDAEERSPATSDRREAAPRAAESAPGTAPAPAPAESAEAPPANTSSPQAEAPEQRTEEGSSWLWPILATLAILGGAVLFFRARRRREDEELEAEPIFTPEPEDLPASLPAAEPVMAAAAISANPAPEAAAAATGVPGIVMRPWLELVFKPARATATEGGASVQYEAVIRNVGNAPARNVRLAACMFNSGQEIQTEVSRFFAMEIETPDGAPLTILPRTEVSLSSVVTMAREEMREIKVQGRSLFIPTVAFNLLYDWGRDKVGQTCSAHVVGREPEPPAEKMAPFRLDLGPRVYRSVGQRPSALARAV